MAWMLLKPGEVPRAPLEAHASTRTGSDEPHAAGEDAWILLGGLDAALFQSGVVSVWLSEIEPPHVLVGGGMAAFNAVFARLGGALAFRVAWERVRSGHMLANAAIARVPLLGIARNGEADPLDIARLLARLPNGAGPLHAIEVHLLAHDGFVDATSARDQELAGIIEESLHAAVTAQTWAAAIEAAIGRGARRVLVPGIEERSIAERDVAHALESAHAHGVEISFLPLTTRQRPGIVGYVLPGLGRADRLWSDGKRSALRWLAALSAGVDVPR